MAGDRGAAAAAALLLVLAGAVPARAAHTVATPGSSPGSLTRPQGTGAPVGSPTPLLPPPGANPPDGLGPPPDGRLGPDPSAQETSLSGPGPLVANGLGSPSCRYPPLRGQLSGSARANCAASGLAVAPAPLEHYQFDVHIDAGPVGLNADRLVQDLLLKPVWMALVWLTHIAVVGLEWCFSLDLLGSGTLGPVSSGLRRMRDVLTTPWLGPVLAVAAIALVYNGIVRRRVVDTLGQLALLLTMMIGGLWVIADPGATVGAASQLANQTSLAALGAAATGDPDHPLRSLDDALARVFEAAVAGPWCYLEFGDVAWCREPDRLDPKLVAAAREVVARDQAEATSPSARRDARIEAAQIARARTNGELFLALPSNGRRRNSINADAANPSLLRVLCGGENANSCSADTAPQAEFRTQKGTAARMGGLLVIAIGAAGMFALIGFLCLRLLGAALLALLYLLLAPVAVLAPALGDGGRAVFRRWSLRLVGAVVAKAVYAVFLGVVLLIVRILAELSVLGWWTEWLLIAAFWWLVFSHRHHVLETVIHERRESAHRSSLANRLYAARQVQKLTAPPARALRGAYRRGIEQLRHLPVRPLEVAGAREAPARSAALDEQVSRSLELDHAAAIATVARAPALELDLAERRERRERLSRELGTATASGDRRRFLSLRRREQVLAGQLAADELELAAARATATAGEEHHRRTGLVHDEEQRTRRAELLDGEALLRPLAAAASDPRRGRRDYAGLASLAGLARDDYERLPVAERRQAQLEIDRQLERRRELSRPSQGSTPRELVARLGRGPSPGDPSDPRPPRQPLGRRERQFARRPPDAGTAPRIRRVLESRPSPERELRGDFEAPFGGRRQPPGGPALERRGGPTRRGHPAERRQR